MAKHVIVPRLWADVPDSERIDAAFLKTRRGANPDKWRNECHANNEWLRLHRPHSLIQLTPEEMAKAWVQKKLDDMNRPDSCAMALRWSNADKWYRCSIRVAPSNTFCYRHGGERPPSKKYVKKSERTHD